MNRIDKLLRPPSTRSNERKQSNANKQATTRATAKSTYGQVQQPARQQLSGLGKIVQQQHELRIKQQELEKATTALEKIK